MALTDESLMPFGAHKDKKLIDVPARYLLWLRDNDKCKGDLENEVITEKQAHKQVLDLFGVSNRREQLIAFANYCEREWNCTEVPIDVIDEYLESN